MAAPYALDDDRVVVIIGSGAGGGTLGNELAQKGVDVVILEAGGRHEIEDFQNDEWGSFSQISWLDPRTTSGDWRVAQGLPRPAGLDRQGGRRLDRALGRRVSLRFQEHEFKALTTYGAVEGANLLDWPITLAELEPYYAKAEDKMGVTNTNGIAPPARQQQLQGPEGRRRHARLQGVPHRQHGDQLGRARRPRWPASRPASASRAASGARSGRRSTPRSRRARRPASSRCGRTARCCRIEHDDSGKVTGVVYADKDGNQQRQTARVVARRRQLDREPAAAAELGLDDVPGRAGQLLRPGRAQLHAPHDRVGLRRVRERR